MRGECFVSRAAELGVHIYGGSESPTFELNGLHGDYSALSELGGFSMGPPDSEELSELGQRDCQSPVSSIDEIERAVAGNSNLCCMTISFFWHITLV